MEKLQPEVNISLSDLEVADERLRRDAFGDAHKESLRSVIGALRPSMLMLPDRLTWPPPWAGHIPFAFYLIDVVRPRRFVELGTHSGNSFCAFLQAAQTLGTGGSFSAVDHWRGDEHAGHYEDLVYEDLAAYVRDRYGDGPALMRMTFDEAQPHFEDGSVDLLHIDGLHTYEAVKHDFDFWLPKMSERGIVLMHDTNVRERDFGVYRLFEEISGTCPTFEFLHSHGLGVAYVGKEPLDGDLRAIMEDFSAEESALFRWMFQRLGDSLSEKCSWQEERRGLRSERDKTVEETRQLSEKNADSARELAAVTAERDRLRDELARFREELSSLRSSIEAQAERHSDSLAKVVPEQAQLTASVLSAEVERSALREDLLQVREQMADQAGVMASLKSALAEIERRTADEIASAAQERAALRDHFEQVIATDRAEAESRRREELAALTASQADLVERMNGNQQELLSAFAAYRDEVDRQRETEREDARQQASQQAGLIEDAQHNLAALKQSTSWRITAPVRAVGGLVKRRD